MLKVIVGLLLLLSSVANAGQLELNWDTFPEGTYRVYQSTDLGMTWIKIVEVSTLPVVVTLPDDVFVLLRFANVMKGSETLRVDSGTWYYSNWASSPKHIKIK